MDGNNIASERRRLGLLQSSLAEELGISVNTLARYEQGKNVPYGTTLAKMARKFGCTTDYLLGLTEERK